MNTAEKWKNWIIYGGQMPSINMPLVEPPMDFSGKNIKEEK